MADRHFLAGKCIGNKGFQRVMAAGCIAAMLVSGVGIHTSSSRAAKRITLNKKKATLQKGSSFTLKIKGARPSKVTYRSSKPSVATVTKRGKVTAKKEGKAKITVKFTWKKRKYSRVCKVTVKRLSTAMPAGTVVSTASAPAVVSSVAPVVPTPSAAAPVPTAQEASASPAVPIATATLKPTPTVKPTPTPMMLLYPTEAEDTRPESYAPSFKDFQHNNPLLTNSFACDPTAMVYDGRIYVYMTNDSQHYEKGQHQEENTYGYINSLHIISSDDMVNWTDHGTFQITGEGGVCSWANCCWAPSAVHKTVDGKEKFYVYFTNGGWSMGVVESDSPTGPFRDIKGENLYISGDDNDKTATGLDPAVFIDDDGSAYITYGGTTGGGRVRKLNDDMMSFADEPIDIKAPHFFEASWMNKINGKYYLSYCSDWEKREGEYADLGLCSIAYMTADSPEGPYTYAGEVLPNCGEVFGDPWGNNHHSIIEFNGEYYIFYQTRTLETAMGIELGFRSTHIDKLTLDENGRIQEVQQTREGVGQTKPFDPYQEVSGLTSWNVGGMNAIHFGDGDAYVTEGAYMETVYSDNYRYSWLAVKGADFGEASPSGFEAKLRGGPNMTAKIFVRADGLESENLVEATVEFDEEGNGTIHLPFAGDITGTHDLYFVFYGYVEEFQHWQFKQSNTP